MPATRDELNAFLDYPDHPVSSASTGPLTGLALGVKDIFDVAGYPTGCGNPDYPTAKVVAKETAPAVRRLLDAGAHFVGKTQTEELAFSLMGQNVHFPHPVNPNAPDRVTGGSSSGSAAAVAGGLCDIATASDTGGSVRGPASFCGLVGLRATHGRIPLAGTMKLAPSLDTFGWFAKDAATCGKVADIFFGEAPAMPRSYRPIRLTVLDELVLGPDEAAEYARMTKQVADILGASLEAGPLSHSIDDLYWVFRRIQAYEAWAMQGDFVATATNMDPAVRARFEFGRDMGCSVAVDETKIRNAFRDELESLIGDDGLLVLPTMPGAAPLARSTSDELQAYRERALRLLCLSGLSGLPQITLPLGAVHGAPFGISLLGPRDSDRDLVQLATHILGDG